MASEDLKATIASAALSTELRLLARTASDDALRAAIAALKGAMPDRANGGTPLPPYETSEQCKADLAAIAGAVVRPGDPRLNIVLGSSATGGAGDASP